MIKNLSSRELLNISIRKLGLYSRPLAKVVIASSSDLPV
ncbi:hypothetical protein P679_1554, partial [Acinetobacter baumannii UH7907]